MATDYQSAMLVRDAPLPEAGVWWTDVDRLQQRSYDSVTVEPNFPDTKQYSYTLNDPRTDFSTDAPPRDTSPVPAYDESSRGDSSGDVTESISTYGGLFESDTDNITKPVTNRDMLYRRRSEWQRNFDLKDEWSHSWTDFRQVLV